MITRESFSGQQPGEEIELYLRKHPLTLVWALRYAVLAAAIGLVALLAAWNLGPQVRGGLFLAWLVLLALVFLASLWEYALWYYDIFVVTNRRLLDFAKKPFIYERRDEAQLSRVQDIRVDFPGPISLLLDFGNVRISTAGTRGVIIFRMVPQPRQVQTRLLELATAAQRKAGGVPGGERREVAEMRSYLGLEVQQPAGPAGPVATAGALPPMTWRQVVRDLFRPSLTLTETDKVWRKHWWRLLTATAVSGTVCNAGLVIGAVMIWQLGVGPWLFLPLFVFLVGTVWNLWNVIDWQNDLYILTDDRIIDIEKVPLISEDRREARLAQIQDVHYVMPHLLNRLLDFGDVEIETAGRGGGFTFSSVPHPSQVQAEIFDRVDRMRRACGATERQQQEGDILYWLGKYRQASSPPDG